MPSLEVCHLRQVLTLLAPRAGRVVFVCACACTLSIAQRAGSCMGPVRTTIILIHTSWLELTVCLSFASLCITADKITL